MRRSNPNFPNPPDQIDCFEHYMTSKFHGKQLPGTFVVCKKCRLVCAIKLPPATQPKKRIAFMKDIRERSMRNREHATSTEDTRYSEV